MQEHKIFKALNRPVLPLGVTDKYLIFLGAVFISFFWFFFAISLWLIPISVLLIVTLYYYGKRKIKNDSKYFLILSNSLKKDGFKKKLVFRK